MSNLFLTLVIAFVIIVFAIACLAIGWLITGKTKIEKACGRDPTQKKDANCQSSCDLCSSPHEQSSPQPKPDSEKHKKISHEDSSEP